MPRRMDIWRCGLVARPVESLLADGWPTSAKVHWLPEPGPGEFLADPFGWRVEGALQVFVERYDYRTRHGTIERYTMGLDGLVLEVRPVLREPWHLSYPQVFFGEGAMWMLPEACKSGGLTLYRGNDALDQFIPEMSIALDGNPIDASVVRHRDRWWLFYSVTGSRVTATGHLHAAWAERLTGPWHPHPGNPVRIDRAGARPAGRAVVIDGRVMLPVQDCSTTYGGAVRPLWVERLDDTAFIATLHDRLAPPPGHGAYRDGMHTLSAAGDYTVFDVKRVDRSGRGLLYGLQNQLRSFGRRAPFLLR